MRRYAGIALGAALFLSGQAWGQSVTFDFEDGTDQGWEGKFDATEAFPINLINGSNRIAVARDGGFQEAEYKSGNASDPFYQAMLAASANEAGYLIEYDWYVDTTSATGSTFLQLGTYVNTGSGYYAQDFPGTGKDVELDGSQLASGATFSGTVSETFAAKGFDLPAGETFFRLGLIINGDGTGPVVHFDNIRVRPIPEPASLSLAGAALAGLPLLRRRK